MQPFSDSGSIKLWYEFKRVHLHESFNFQWLQLCSRSKFITKENYENVTNLTIHDHCLVKGSAVITLHKLTSIEISSTLILKSSK